MDDLISRQAAIDTIRHVTCSFRLKSDINFENYREEIQEIFNHVRDAQEKALNELPSAQPEIKPIEYRDCSNALLRMWMDEVITDGDYNRIMDKLNAYWRSKDD